MEYIIKYTGNILSLGYPTELLDAQFAIMELEEESPERLLAYWQVTSFEPARRAAVPPRRYGGSPVPGRRR